jgi:hypothetical protein
MTTDDLATALATAIGACCVVIGWLARGIFQEFRRRRQQKAWARSRLYLPSSNSKHR